MSRQLNKTLEQCKAIKLQLDLGLSVFFAAKKETTVQKYLNTLLSLGIEATVEPQYTQPNLEPLHQTDGYDSYISEWYQPEKELTGYIIKKK